MITLKGNSTPEIQQALTQLERQLVQINGSLAAAGQDVTMTVGVGPIPNGAAVDMSGNSTVILAVTDWVGINAGPTAATGEPIQVRGGRPVEAVFPAGQAVVAGTICYFSLIAPGKFTVTQPAGAPPAVGVIYDVGTYMIGTGAGVAKVLLNSNFLAP